MMTHEIMFDLETLDTRKNSVVLSVGAVVFNTEMSHPMSGGPSELKAVIVDRFYRVLEMDSQLARLRSISQSTLLWWMGQNLTAREEAFNPVRQDVEMVLNSFWDWSETQMRDHKVNAFWASPSTFDFPIWETLAADFGAEVPWTYRQCFDVRTVVKEASYSVEDHNRTTLMSGVPHTPVYDCEWQVDLMTAARNKARRRMTA